MKKRRVVFLFYHGIGHINAFLGPARALQERNYEVYFSGLAFFKDYVELQNFKFHILKALPFGYGLEEWSNVIAKKRFPQVHGILDRIKDKLFIDREPELFWMLQELQPEFVLIDVMQATDFIVLCKYAQRFNIRIAMVNTMLPMEIAPGYPPLNSTALPGSNELKSVLRISTFRSIAKRAFKKIRYAGFDDKFLVKRRIRSNNIPPRYLGSQENLLNFFTRNIPEFVLAPSEFDYPDSPFIKKKHYVGFQPTTFRKQQIQKDTNEKLQTLFVKRKETGKKLIYCSFGSIPPKRITTLHALIKKIRVVAGEKDYLMIISLPSLERRENDRINDNVLILDSVPQLLILQHADVFITHAGLNSIKESIYAEVPMLAYPMHPRFDPTGNAARIQYHGLGLKGEVKSTDRETIKNQLHELLTDPKFKVNVKRMKDADQRYTGENFVQLIETTKSLRD